MWPGAAGEKRPIWLMTRLLAHCSTRVNLVIGSLINTRAPQAHRPLPSHSPLPDGDGGARLRARDICQRAPQLLSVLQRDALLYPQRAALARGGAGNLSRAQRLFSRRVVRLRAAQPVAQGRSAPGLHAVTALYGQRYL